MTAFASLVLADAAAANQTFGTQSIDSTGLARWMDANATYDAKRTVTQQVILPKNGSPVVRVKQRVSIPVMDAVDSTKVLGLGYVNIEFVMPKNMATDDRNDLLAFAKSLLAHANSTAAVGSFEAVA